jgi:hypothetical protein
MSVEGNSAATAAPAAKPATATASGCSRSTRCMLDCSVAWVWRVKRDELSATLRRASPAKSATESA